MKSVTLNSPYGMFDCALHAGTYELNGQPAWQLMDDEGPVAWASVCIPGYDLPDGHILIKDWSENEGMLASLVDAGLVEDTGQLVPTGYAAANLCRIL